VLVEHTEEAIVSGRFPVVIPFLGVASYLISVIKLESDERINNLRGAKILDQNCATKQNETEIGVI
jgi:hypothetical protein